MGTQIRQLLHYNALRADTVKLGLFVFFNLLQPLTDDFSHVIVTVVNGVHERLVPVSVLCNCSSIGHKIKAQNFKSALGQHTVFRKVW